MKTTSKSKDVEDDATSTSSTYATCPRYKPKPRHPVKAFKKKPVHSVTVLFDDSEELTRLLPMPRARPRMTIPRRRSGVMSFSDCARNLNEASIRDNCNIVSLACETNTDSYDDLLQPDPTTKLPRFFCVTYCDSCQSYSHTGRKHWLKLHLGSSLTKEFLVGRIKIHTHLLGLKVINSWIVDPDVDPASKSTIVVGLLLEFEAYSGESIRRICKVVYNIAYQTCSDCSQPIDYSQLTSVVELRQYGSDCRTRKLLQSRILRRMTAFNIKMIKPKQDGMDFFFTDYGDATAVFDFLTTQSPVKCYQIEGIKKNPSSNCSSDHGSTMRVISLVVCPIYYPSDLVYLPLMVSDALGLQHMGPLAICIGSSDTIRLLNPLNLKQCSVNFDDYWRNPFEPVMSARDLVEYVVLNVQIVSSEGKRFLADVQVARVSDSGKNDATVLTRTHLGHVLKAGDHAFGYDLHDLNIAGIEMEKFKQMLPGVVLIKKKYLAPKQPKVKSRKHKSPEYAQFLKDLESNPEALFNLSLNGGDDEKQNSKTLSEKPGNLELELEDLLADLDLNDQ